MVGTAMVIGLLVVLPGNVWAAETGVPPAPRAPAMDAGHTPILRTTATMFLHRNSPSPSAPGVAPTGVPGTRGWTSPHAHPIGAPIAPGLGHSCYGRWPTAGQSAYTNDCYGHDEPGLEPFSTLPGSGGNVTWNVSLPVDRSPTQNQSDLYAAIWFGMNLYDPLAYLSQCFLELQLYPDLNAAGVPQNGVWSGYAVGWQIELSNGYEDPCYGANLLQSNSTNGFQMGQGDHLNVTMSGWVGSPYGENISIRDLTNGETSFLNLYNTTGGYPLDPAYSTNDVQDALQWSPGGDLPVSFAFEGGHTASGPSNNSFGGCSSGTPPPTRHDPAVPCGTYDPASWANDTLVPWHIYPTVFFNAKHRATASQVGVIQDFGGIGWVDALSNGACVGGDLSAWCSYPWFSYSTGAAAFEFGAIDFPGASSDFGQANEYPTQYEFDAAALPFYAIRNFSVPDPVGPSLSVTVVGNGTAYVLDQVVTGSSTITLRGISPGAYSINAVPSRGSYFGGYLSAGGVAMDANLSAWSSFSVTGSGSITVRFAPTPSPAVAVTFVDTPARGNVSLVAGFAFTPLPLNENISPTIPFNGRVVQPAMTIGNATVAHLAPGIYSLHALPNPGYNFTRWSGTAGLFVFDTESNLTWVNVTGPGTLTAAFVPTPMVGSLTLTSDPASGGGFVVGGVLHSSGSTLNLPTGAYTVTAVPNATYAFDTWTYLGSLTTTNFSSTTIVVIQNGSSVLTAMFNSTPVVTLAVVGSGGAAINGTVVRSRLALPQVADKVYPLAAIPGNGSKFVGWTIAPASAARIGNLSVPLTLLTVRHSVTLTAHFATASANATVEFNTSGGTIWFNEVTPYSSDSVNSSVGGTKYALAVVPAPGNVFAGWSSGGAVSVQTSYALSPAGEYFASYALRVLGSGRVTAQFVAATFPVTFVDYPSVSGTQFELTSGPVRAIVPTGTTAALPPGNYTVTITGGTVPTAVWIPTSNVSLAGSGTTASLWVRGSATVVAWATSRPIAGAWNVDPSPLPVTRPINLTFGVLGGTEPFTFAYALDPKSPTSGLVGLGPVLSSSNTTTDVVRAPTAGTFVVDVTVTDSAGASLSSNVTFTAGTVTAHVAIGSPTSALTLNAAVSTNLTANVSVTAGNAPIANLFETVAIVDPITGGVLTNTPSASNWPGDSRLFFPATVSTSIALAPADLAPGLTRLPAGAYELEVGLWSIYPVAPNGFPTTEVMTTDSAFDVALVRIDGPLPAAILPTGNATATFELEGPPTLTAGWLNLTGPSGSVDSIVVSRAGGAQSLPLTLPSPGVYDLELQTVDIASHKVVTVSETFSSATPAPGNTIYRNGTVTHSATSTALLLAAGLGGLVAGAIIGGLIGWRRGRRGTGGSDPDAPIAGAAAPSK